MKHSVESMKRQAKRLRASLANTGRAVSHSQALELVAHQHGHRDWNTAFVASGQRPNRPPAELGERVDGHYLGQPFTGTVVGIEALAKPGRWRMTFRFDKPVDVVTFDSFSAFRSRVTAIVNAEGRTAERTSNGLRHLALATH